MTQDHESLAQLFKALSEPVRLRILHLLLPDRELCVCELVDSLALGQSLVSRHLAYLRNHGLLASRRKGVWIYYRLDEALPAPLKVWLAERLSACAELDRDRIRLAATHNPCESEGEPR